MGQKTIRMMLIASACLLVSLGMSNSTFAHGTGVSFEETKNGYTVDIGYDESIFAGAPSRFDFILHPDDTDTVEGEVFTDVWVRVAQGRNLFFSGDMHKPIYGSTGFTYIFPKEGVYEIFSRFQKDDDTLVESTFTVEVGQSPDAQGSGTLPFAKLLFALVGLVLGGLTTFFLTRKK